MHEELKAAGFDVSRKRIARLMVELGLEGRRKRRFKATTDSKHNMPIAKNILDRNFEVDAPDVAWVTDITYVWTAEGWLYLAAILDLFSRRVVGFAMSEHIDRALVLEALRAAVGRHVPNAGLMHHSLSPRARDTGHVRRQVRPKCKGLRSARAKRPDDRDIARARRMLRFVTIDVASNGGSVRSGVIAFGVRLCTERRTRGGGRDVRRSDRPCGGAVSPRWLRGLLRASAVGRADP